MIVCGLLLKEVNPKYVKNNFLEDTSKAPPKTKKASSTLTSGPLESFDTEVSVHAFSHQFPSYPCLQLFCAHAYQITLKHSLIFVIYAITTGRLGASLRVCVHVFVWVRVCLCVCAAVYQ